jgi:hypothetical protein
MRVAALEIHVLKAGVLVDRIDLAPMVPVEG